MRVSADAEVIRLMAARDNLTGNRMVQSLSSNPRPDWAEEREPNLYRFTWDEHWDIYYSVNEDLPETIIRVTAVEIK